jgi:hypothetical protein
MMVCGRQLEALWVLSEPTSGMTDMLWGMLQSEHD